MARRGASTSRHSHPGACRHLTRRGSPAPQARSSPDGSNSVSPCRVARPCGASPRLRLWGLREATAGPISTSMERPRATRRADAMICPQFHRLWREMLKYEGGFRVLSQQSESANNRPDIAGQNGAIVHQSARLFSAGERHAAETPATGDKATSGERKHWLDYATAFLTLAAAGGAITAAVFTGWQATTADQGLRDSNRAYVHSTNFRFVHYGAKNESGRTQWSISPLIENTGTTGTRGMLMSSIISSADEPDFDSLEKTPFSPGLILPKSEMTGAVVSMDGRGLDVLRGGGLIVMGIITLVHIFGVCNRV